MIVALRNEEGYPSLPRSNKSRQRVFLSGLPFSPLMLLRPHLSNWEWSLSWMTRIQRQKEAKVILTACPSLLSEGAHNAHTRGERDLGLILRAFPRQSIVMGTVVSCVPGEASFTCSNCRPTHKRKAHTQSCQEKTLKAGVVPWYIPRWLPEENSHSTGPS